MDQVTFPRAVTLICDKILRAEVGRSEVLDHIVTAVHALFAVRRVSLWLVTGTNLEIVAGWPRVDGAHGIGRRFTFQQRPHLAESIAEQKTTIVDIATAELADEVRAFCTGHKVSTIIIVPLVVNGRSIGALVLDRTNDDPMFDGETMTLCSAVANLAAVAIHNAELATREHQLSQEVEVATRAITTSAVLAMVHHQIRNATVAAGGFARRLVNDPTGAGVQKNAQQVVEEVTRIEHALKEVAEASGVTSPHKVGEVDLVATINSVLTRFAPRFADHLVVANFHPNGLERQGYAQVLAVQAGLEIVFENIFENPLDAMPTGGKLNISCSVSEHFLIVEITNTGPPISQELAERVFNPFVTTRETGTGLGLYQVYQILAAWGSSIHVRTPKDAPPTFVLSFSRK